MKTIIRKPANTKIPCCLLGLVIVALLFVTVQQTLAGGLYINEFGTPSMGAAGAGAEAVAMDASTSFHNPAGMTRLKGKQLMVTGGIVATKIKFDPSSNTPIPGSDGGDAGGFAPLMSTAYVHSITDKLKFGVNMFSVSAAVVNYDNNWTGRYLNNEVSIFTITLNPVIAYKVTDWWSVGGGVGGMYAMLEMKLDAPPPPPMAQAQLRSMGMILLLVLTLLPCLRSDRKLVLVLSTGQSLIWIFRET